MKTRFGYKVYPLTAAQKLHFYYQKFCPKKQVLNIGTSVTIETDIDWAQLEASIRKAYERCEAMRLRFTQDKEGNVYQYVVKKEEREIEFYDFRHWQPEDVEKELRRWTSIPMERFDSPMNRVVMVALPEGYNGLYLLVDHMTMDAQSLIVFIRDIIELYCSAVFEDVPVPSEMVSYLEQLNRDLAYENGSRAQQKDREFFQQLIEESEPLYNDIDGSKRLKDLREIKKNPNLRSVVDVSQSVDSDIDVFHLEAEPTKRLMDFCEKYQVSMVCLLMMGLRTYFQKFNDTEDVSIVTTVARRATLREKKSGGTRIHCFPFRSVVSGQDTFLKGIEKIRDGQNRIFRHANYNPVEYYSCRSKFYELESGGTYEPISLTYQPLTLREKGLAKLGDIKYRTRWYPNGVAAHRLYLTVMHRSEDNGMDFSFEHQLGAYSRQRLEYFYYYICRILFKGIENPELTVNDIIQLV